MKDRAFIRWAVLAAALMVGACTRPPPKMIAAETADFKTNVSAPAGAARVYILPTLSKGLFTDLDGRAGITIFAENSEKGAPLAWTSKSTFVAFDIAPGTYDVMAYSTSSILKFTKALTFNAGNVYFYRPTFFRSEKDLSAKGSGPDSVNNGMNFEPVPAEAGRAEIHRMDMSALKAEGQNFLAMTRAGGMPPRYAVPAQTYYPQPLPDTGFKTVEQKLSDLQQLYNKKLITKEDYDAKRQAILNAY